MLFQRIQLIINSLSSRLTRIVAMMALNLSGYHIRNCLHKPSEDFLPFWDSIVNILFSILFLPLLIVNPRRNYQLINYDLPTNITYFSLRNIIKRLYFKLLQIVSFNTILRQLNIVWYSRIIVIWRRGIELNNRGVAQSMCDFLEIP